MTQKVVVVGVGNSGTKLLAECVWKMLKALRPDCKYYYEPLYWFGENGVSGIVENEDGLKEHLRFPLLPSDDQSWPYMDDYLQNLEGLAKFIRLGSRLKTVIHHDIKFLWITRELYSYLGSMSKNFPRCLPDAGWHHRPGRYDDFERIDAIYSEFDLDAVESKRMEVEACWWHLHNSEVYALVNRGNLLRVKYEDLCEHPIDTLKSVERFLEMKLDVEQLFDADSFYPNPVRHLDLSSEQFEKIEAIAGKLNKRLYR